MLKLRPYKASDAKIIVKWIKDERALRLWSADRYKEFPITAKDMNKLYDSVTDVNSFWAMTAFDESGVVGHLTMRFVDEEKTILRFGFVIVDDTKREKGYGKEMLNLAIHYAFHIAGAQKVTLGVFESNKAAFECYKAVGFERARDKKISVFKFSFGEMKNIELEMNSDFGSLVGINFAQQKWDTVTGMYNVQGLVEKLEQWKNEGRFSNTHLTMICLDVDGLSNINNIYGRVEGDSVIKIVAKIIDDALSKNEVSAHTGGSEFVIAFPEKEQVAAKRVEELIEMIKERVKTFNTLSGKDYDFAIRHRFVISEVFGTSSMFELVENALRSRGTKDGSQESPHALSKAKKSKEMFKPDEEKALLDVLDHNKFKYAFQPIIDAKTGNIYGYEALMRSDTEMQLSPLTILQYATLNNRLVDVERSTINNVLRYIAKHREIFGTKKVFINSIPGYYLPDEEYEEHLKEYGDLFDQIVIEITEQTELDDNELERILYRSEKAGFKLAIDDYGSGYSNTSSLLRYVPNCVKIDRLLISNIQEEPKKQHFVKSIIEFSHDNGILVLAEGVETETELKAVIGMGVDLIQGYYTARPSFEILSELPEKLVKEVLHGNLMANDKTVKKIFVVDGQKELPLMRLALEQYSGLVLASQEFTLVGNPSYDAAFTIKIKEDSVCKLTLKDVRLDSLSEIPCIEIGKGAHLTLVIEGENSLEGGGIRVPEGSTIELEGGGTLKIHPGQFVSYGIGTEIEAGVGTIISRMTGVIDITVDGTTCIGIGGGVYNQGDGINVSSGSIKILAAGVAAVGIGCMQGDMPIKMKKCGVDIEVRVSSGIGIGNLYGNQNIEFESISVNIEGSGSTVCGIGSTQITGGLIHIITAKTIIKLNGQQVIMCGTMAGAPTIRLQGTGVECTGEGAKVMGIGAYDESAVLELLQSTAVVCIRAGEYIPIAVKEENKHYVDGREILKINED